LQNDSKERNELAAATEQKGQLKQSTVDASCVESEESDKKNGHDADAALRQGRKSNRAMLCVGELWRFG